MFQDYYRVLGVGRHASQEEIKKAYYDAARECHPDLHPESVAASRRFREIQQAFDVLGDPDARTKYNQQYDARFRTAPPPPPDGTQSADSTTSGAPPVSSFSTGGRRPRKKASAVAEILKIVLGGIAGLILAWLVLTYGVGIDLLGPTESDHDNRGGSDHDYRGEVLLPAG